MAAALMILPLLTTCSMEERLGPVTGYGIPASVTMNFGVKGHTVYTRASQSEEDENRVDNLYILVFDEEGNKLDATNDNGDPLNFFTTSPEDNFSGLSYDAGNLTGNVRFNVNYSGRVTIVGVANIKEGSADSGYDLTKADLDAFDGNLEDLRKYVVGFSEARSPLSRGSHFLMTGSVETVIGSTADYDVLEDELVLERVDAKVTVSLSVNIEDGGGITYSNINFEPKTWKVMRLPQQSLLLPYTGTGEGPWEDEKSWDAETGATKNSSASAGYTDTDEYEMEVSSSHLDDQTMLADGGSFTFYMPENRKKYKASAGSYTDREKIDEADGSFAYADPNSTYIVVNGNLTFIATQSDETEIVVDAFVTFTLHLGLGASAGGNHNNYDTRRNSDYTYNITVTGIESITTDVTEGRPGYEGDIIYNYNTQEKQTLFTLDAHYETRLISIPKDADFSKMTWSVNTPFSSGVHVEGGDNSALTDYEWIKFAVNAHYTDWNSDVTDGKTFAQFPGTVSTGILHYYNGESRTSEAIDDMGLRSRSHPLMNVDQLIKYLQWRSSAADGGIDRLASNDGNIYITAFIDEYYYPDKDWKEFVNTTDRQMHIISEKSDNFSFYNASYSFIQRSIRSIYNSTSSSKVTKAWGVETVTEPVNVGPNEDSFENADPLLAPGEEAIRNHAGSLSLDNGWKNTSVLWENNIFASAVNSDNYTLKDNYRNAVYACLLRNRDENGDGSISEDELKWYLASIDQLTDLYIGEWALNKASFLYPDEMRDREKPYYHYTTNSPNSGDDNEPWIFWAEEGASRGSYDTSQEVLREQDNPNDNNKYSYRCLRNLFPEGTDKSAEPDLLVTVSGNTLDLSNLHPDALRTSPVYGELPAHDEQSEYNKAYRKFEVHPETSPEVETSWDWSGVAIFSDRVIDFTNTQEVDNFVGETPPNYCPSGYRIPNQRELLIMSTFLQPDDWETFEYNGWSFNVSGKPFYISRTRFSMRDKAVYTEDGKHRFGFIYRPEANEFFLQNNTGERGYVRCIKDVETP